MKDIVEIVIAMVILIVLTVSSLYASITLKSRIYASGMEVTEYFKDENLKNAIIELAEEATGEKDIEKIFESDIDKIVEMSGGTTLKLSGKGIKDLSGLELFAQKNITWIFLDWNEIEDISVISNFNNLTKISFSGNNVHDLLPLANIQTLSNITAINNQIDTIEPLANLKEMKYINLDGNNIEDINTITNWTSLTEMSFQCNKVTTIPDLSNQSLLKHINLSNNMIQSITTMGNLPSIEKFEIDSNNLTSLDGIQNCSSLKYLSCSDNQIEQLNEIEGLSNLENLNINKNKVQDINNIEKNEQIKYLYMDANQIQNYEPLRNLQHLEKYTIYNQIYMHELNKKPNEERIQIELPSVYKNLFNKDSFIYKEKLNTIVKGTDNYEINETISIPVEDLEKDSITVEVSDNYNIILRYIIVLKEEEDVFEINNYEIDNNFIKNIIPDISYEEFANSVNTNMNFFIKEGEHNISNTEKIKTGQLLIVGDKTYVLVIKGDVNSDGKSNLMDILIMNQHRLEKMQFTETQLIAGDLNNDGIVNITDILEQNKDRLTKEK